MIQDMENPHGGNIYDPFIQNKIMYDFSANVNPFGTPDKVKNAVMQYVENMHKYPDAHCRELTQAVAGYESISESNIIFGNGASELIYTFVQAVCPKKAIVVVPTFCEYEAALKANGCKVERFYVREKENYQPLKYILNDINENVDAVFICNPNNPTGVLYQHEFMKQITDKCREHECYLFVDECFMDFVEESKRYSLKSELENNEKVFILKAFTKSFGMAGVRLGYGMCSNKELLLEMSKYTQAWNISGVAQAAGVAAVGCKEFLDKSVEYIKKEREYMTDELRQKGYSVVDSSVNFILFEADMDLYYELLEKGVLIRQCNNFNGIRLGYYRCAVKSHEENEYLLSLL